MLNHLCQAYLFNQIFNLSSRFVGSVGSIIVKCKDLRVIQLDIPGMEECLNIASSIEVSIVLTANCSLLSLRGCHVLFCF